MAAAKPFVSYYRVSTERQGQSGLGLEAQRMLSPSTSPWRAVRSSRASRRSNRARTPRRPALAAALAACRTLKATLIIAKLDRLARNSVFLLSIVEGSGVGGVVFCDLP